MRRRGRGEDSDDDPVTPEELKIVERGRGTPEQIARVHAALDDPDSPISRWLKESQDWAREHFSWRFVKHPAGRAILGITTAQNNYYTVMEYVHRKGKTGFFSKEDLKAIVAATAGDDMSDPEPTNSQYAIAVTRIIRTIVKLHPELESEVRSLPASGKKNR